MDLPPVTSARHADQLFQLSLLKINPMFFLVLGILLLIAGFVIAGRADSLRRYGRPV
jgi:hypothetical protein